MLERLTERLRRTDRNDGFIIVAVLWILAALATLAAVIAVYVINSATAFAVHDERVQAEGLTRAAVEDERRRIARDLHDVIAHSVSVMTVQASGVRRLLRPDQDREREALLVVERTGREALAEMRRMVGVLRRP